jgi:hypothetical protein
MLTDNPLAPPCQGKGGCLGTSVRQVSSVQLVRLVRLIRLVSAVVKGKLPRVMPRRTTPKEHKKMIVDNISVGSIL